MPTWVFTKEQIKRLADLPIMNCDIGRKKRTPSLISYGNKK